jgi:hypothetical protein
MDNCKEIAMKLWQYGCSVSLGEEATKPYGMWIAETYGYEFVQQSESSASNPYIALKFSEQYTRITPEDLVIFGWSHPSRNSWYNKHTNRWEHLNYIQQKKRSSALTGSVIDYIQNQLCEYTENVNDWYPKHIVETTCTLNNLKYLHVDCVPRMVDYLMPNKNKYIADHLHPNDLGHQQIFELIKSEIDSILYT